MNLLGEGEGVERVVAVCAVDRALVKICFDMVSVVVISVYVKSHVNALQRARKRSAGFSWINLAHKI